MGDDASMDPVMTGDRHIVDMICGV